MPSSGGKSPPYPAGSPMCAGRPSSRPSSAATLRPSAALAGNAATSSGTSACSTSSLPSRHSASTHILNVPSSSPSSRSSRPSLAPMGSPSVQTTWRAVTSTTPRTSRHGRPSLRSCGSMSCAYPSSGPASTTTVRPAVDPTLAKTGSSFISKTSSSCSLVAEPMARPHQPRSRSATAASPGRASLSSSRPSAAAMTPLAAKKSRACPASASRTSLSFAFFM
mmetsp:Transcript_9690/g.39885  ORF Transcript_9690/g.39885 Transcript_9690/m.39885 type:complete len:222 (-) Transcript_9690:238-903(-)